MRMLQLEHLLRRDRRDSCETKTSTRYLLKGAGLAYTAYSSFPDRPMGDIDLLVPSPHAERAWSLLQTHGWTSAGMKIERDRYSGHQHFPRLVTGGRQVSPGDTRRSSAGGAPVPVFHGRRLGPAPRHVTVKGQVMTAPHPIHQLWHACVHFAWSHAFQWGSWRAFRDVAAIIHRNGD